MTDPSVLSDDFLQAVREACSNARSAAVKAGQPVVHRTADGIYVAEYPGGRRFEVLFDASRPREFHMVVLRELSSNAA